MNNQLGKLTTMQVSIAQAAQRLNISTATVRRRLHNGILNGEKTPTPQGFIWTVEVPEEPRQPDQVENTADNNLVELLRQQLMVKDQQIDRLTQLLGAKALNNGHRPPWWAFWQR